MPEAERLIDGIYEAAIAPERWPAVLEELARYGEGFGALMFTLNGGEMRWIGSPATQDLLREYVAQGWPARTTRADRLFEARHPGFLGDLDVYTRDEMDRELVFTEFLRPRGLGWGTATAIPVPSGDSIVVDIERTFDRGPYDRKTINRLDLLRPHLARASLFSARLGLDRARSAAETLGLVGLPAAVLGQGGRLLAANAAFEALIPDIAEDRRGRVQMTDGAADSLWNDICARLGLPAHEQGVGSIAVRARTGHSAMILHVIPLAGVANDVFSSAAAVLVVTPVERRNVPTAEVIQMLFDLTPSEARVARAIAEGLRVDAIAAAQGVSAETVRSHLKATLKKTGANRQADLVSLLAGLSGPARMG